MEKRVAVVTGSTSGIGLGIAEALAGKGHDLVIHGLGDPAEISRLVDRLRSEHRARVVVSDADLSKGPSGQELIRFAERELGRVDVLVNNAGIQHVAPIESFPDDRWDAVIAINLSSAFHTTKAALPGMRARGYGRILNIASAHGLVASPQKAAYVAAKHGLIGFTKVTALETAGAGITCNAICPGWVKTPLVARQIEARAKEQGIPVAQAEKDLLREKQPNGEFTTPEQLGELVVFLAGDAARTITGASLSIDGGWTAQ